MFILNGKKFAKNDREFTNSLFDPSGSCIGYYKKVSGGIRLINTQGGLFAFIRKPSHGAPFIVSAYTVGNRARYMYALACVDAAKLELYTLGEQAEALAAAFAA